MPGLFDKANDFLKSDQGEQASDTALDKASETANRITGGAHEDAVKKGRDTADQHLGDE